MPDIPSSSAVSAVSATAAAASNNIVVETLVNSVPDKIAMLARQIEVTGTLAAPPQGATVTINTLIGPLTLLLPQLAQLQQDKLIQQLMTLFQNQRSLTVVMQPGNPPAQAFLLLPPVTTPSQSAASAYSAAQTSNAPPPITQNLVLSAIVLPDSSEPPPALSPPPAAQSQLPQAPILPPAYAALTPTPTPAIPVSPLQSLIAEEVISNLEQQLPPNPAAPANTSPAPFPSYAPAPQGTSPFAVPPLPAAPYQPQSPAAYLNLPQAPAGFSAIPPEPENFAFAPIPSPSAPASNAPASLSSLLQPGTELTLRVTSVVTPGTPIPPLQPNQIVATVTGSGPGGQIILKAGDATLFVRQPLSAPPGTQLVITVDPVRGDTAPVTLPEALEFSSLPQIIAALAQTDPAALRQIAARMPQPSEALPSTLLLFLSAVRDGDVRGWLGNDVSDSLIRAGKAELINRLVQELQSSDQPSHDDVVGQWRSYAVPIFDNNNLAVFYLHIHNAQRRQHGDHGKQAEGDAPPAQQMRFVIDVRMSRLGLMQLDGFLRQRKLDIVVRSENRLPAWVDSELRQTYKRTLDAIGYAGGISFQSGRGNWVNIQKPAAGAAVVT